MARLDREPQIAWQMAEILRENRISIWAKGGRKLQEAWAGPVAQEAQERNPLPGFFDAAKKHFLVTDSPGKLEAEAKAFGGIIAPTPHEIGLRHGVEGGVSLHHVQPAAVGVEEFAGRRAGGKEAAHPLL